MARFPPPSTATWADLMRLATFLQASCTTSLLLEHTPMRSFPRLLREKSGFSQCRSTVSTSLRLHVPVKPSAAYFYNCISRFNSRLLMVFLCLICRQTLCRNDQKTELVPKIDQCDDFMSLVRLPRGSEDVFCSVCGFDLICVCPETNSAACGMHQHQTGQDTLENSRGGCICVHRLGG